MEVSALTLGVLILLLVLAGGAPVAIALSVGGIVGILVIDGLGNTFGVLEQLPLRSVASYSLLAIPFYLALGSFASRSGVAFTIFRSLGKVLYRFPAGLGMSTVLGSAAFGAMTGSSVGTVAAIGKPAVDGMVSQGYQRHFAAGLVSASGTLAVLIPPSVALVIYAITVNESVGGLLIGGVLPGVFSALIYVIGIGLLVWRRPGLVDRERVASAPFQANADLSPVRRLISKNSGIGAGLRMGILASVVVGLLYLGLLTAVESAAVGAMIALVFLIMDSEGGARMRLAAVVGALNETVRMTCMLFLLLVGSAIFTRFIVLTGAPRALGDLAAEAPVPPAIVVLVLLLTLIPLGMFLDGMAIILIMAPLIYPIAVTEFGFSGIWIGILFVKFIELGLITPPVGLNVYVTSGVTSTPASQVFRGVAPFVILDCIIIACIFVFPWIVTVLPSMML